MHNYRFLIRSFQEGKPVREGNVTFPVGATPYLPKAGDQIVYKTNDDTRVAGTVKKVAFNFQFVASDNITQLEIEIGQLET